jgi:hypothetical protein
MGEVFFLIDPIPLCRPFCKPSRVEVNLCVSLRFVGH